MHGALETLEEGPSTTARSGQVLRARRFDDIFILEPHTKLQSDEITIPQGGLRELDTLINLSVFCFLSSVVFFRLSSSYNR